MKNPSLLILSVVLAAVSLSVGLAKAETRGSAPLDFDSLSADKAFKNLPGVKPPQEQEAKRDFECTTRFDDDGYEIFPGPDRMRPNLVYSCTDGLVTLESRSPPRSLEREKRGLDW